MAPDTASAGRLAENLRGAGFMTVSMLGFSGNDAFMKSVADELALSQAVFIRSLLTTLFIAAVAWRQGARKVVLRDAFRYDWRLWSLPELTAALREAGFSDALVWRHTYDRKSGRVFFGPVAEMTDRPTWSVYVVGVG